MLFRRLSHLVEHAPLLARIGLHVSLGLLGLLVLFAYLGLQVVQTMTDDIVQHRLVIAQMMATQVDGDLRARLQAMQVASAELAALQGTASAASTRRALQNLNDGVGPGALGSAILDETGRLIHVEASPGTPVEAVQPDLEAAAASLHAGEPTVSSARPWGGRPLVTLVVPLGSSPGRGATAGLLACVIDASRLRMADSVATSRQLGRTMHVELVDQRGLVLATSEPGRALQPGEHPDFFEPLLASRATGTSVRVPLSPGQASWRHQPHSMAFVPLETAPWGLMLGATTEETLAPVHRLQAGFLFLGLLGLLTTLLLLTLTANYVIAPLGALTRAAERIARGNLGSPVPSVGVAEVETLAHAFERMRRQLWSSERELAVGKSRFEGIFKAIADPVFTVDTELRITSVNPAAERLLGWRADEVVGKRCNDLVHLADEHGRATCHLVCPLLVRSSPPAAKPDGQELMTTTTGRDLTVAATRSAIRDETGRVVGMVHVLRDISAEAEANRLKDQFVASVSHELRTPLGHIKGFTTTLLRQDARWEARKARHFLEVIDASADRLAEQIDNLLDISRIHAGALSIERKPVDLSSLVHGLVERLQPRAEGHRLVLEIPPDLPPAAGDQRRIEQVLHNLLDNALKYSPSGGEIRIQLTADRSSLWVRVCDEGIGVPADEREAIFARFHRVNDPAVQGIRGSGLGLAICRGIVEAHGGAIWAEPAIGKGSVFTFTLPIWNSVVESAHTTTDHTQASLSAN